VTWIRIDDGFVDHPKIVKLSLAAFHLHMAGLCYAARHATDGAVPKAALPGLNGTRRDAAELVRAGLWDRADDGWTIHDYLMYNPSSDDVRRRREEARDRMADMRAARRGGAPKPPIISAELARNGHLEAVRTEFAECSDEQEANRL